MAYWGGGSFLLSPNWKSPQTHTLESTGSLHSKSPSSRYFTDGIFFILQCESFGLMRSLCLLVSMSLAYVFILGVKNVTFCTNMSEKFWTAYMPNDAYCIMQQRPSRWGIAHWKRGVFLTDVKSWQSPLALPRHECSRRSHMLGLTRGFHFRLANLSSQSHCFLSRLKLLFAVKEGTEDWGAVPEAENKTTQKSQAHFVSSVGGCTLDFT